MITKNILLEELTKHLGINNVDDADEIAESFVEHLDEEGFFSVEEEDL